VEARATLSLGLANISSAPVEFKVKGAITIGLSTPLTRLAHHPAAHITNVLREGASPLANKTVAFSLSGQGKLEGSSRVIGNMEETTDAEGKHTIRFNAA